MKAEEFHDITSTCSLRSVGGLFPAAKLSWWAGVCMCRAADGTNMRTHTHTHTTNYSDWKNNDWLVRMRVIPAWPTLAHRWTGSAQTLFQCCREFESDLVCKLDFIKEKSCAGKYVDFCTCHVEHGGDGVLKGLGVESRFMTAWIGPLPVSCAAGTRRVTWLPTVLNDTPLCVRCTCECFWFKNKKADRSLLLRGRSRLWKKNKKTKKRQENCGNDHKFAKGEISLGWCHIEPRKVM